MSFFHGANDFEINGGSFRSNSNTNMTDNRTTITNRGGISMLGVVAPGGRTEIGGDVNLSRGQLPVGQQHSRLSSLPHNPDALLLGRGGAGNRTMIGANGTGIQNVNQERDQMLLALATAILQLQGPAYAILQALGEQTAAQIPISVQPPSTVGGAFQNTAVAAIASTIASLPATPAQLSTPLPTPPIARSATPSPTPSTDTRIRSSGSTTSIPQSEKRKSPLRKFFGKKSEDTH